MDTKVGGGWLMPPPLFLERVTPMLHMDPSEYANRIILQVFMCPLIPFGGKERKEVQQNFPIK